MEHKTKEEVERAADVAVKDVLALKEGERILIITNPKPDVRTISEALYSASERAGALPVMMVQPVKNQLDTASPEVISAIATEPDVVLSISHEKLGKDPNGLKEPYRAEDKEFDHIFTYLLHTGRIRSFWSPGITEEMFIRTVPIHYSELRERAAKLKGILTDAEEVHITAPSGTDLRIGLRGRKAMADDGDFRRPGSGGNIPCGEVFISPQLRSSSGKIAFDGSISAHEGVIIISTPIVCEVKDGHIVSITGGREAEALKHTLEVARKTTEEFLSSGKIPEEKGEAYLKNITNLGELGIGLNPAAQIVGNMLEDEKVLRTVHIAVGSNYDEDAPALIHLDGLIKAPTVTARMPDGTDKELMRNGEIIL